MSINISKGLRRGLVCGAALVMLASAGVGMQNVAGSHNAHAAQMTRLDKSEVSQHVMTILSVGERDADSFQPSAKPTDVPTSSNVTHPNNAAPLTQQHMQVQKNANPTSNKKVLNQHLFFNPSRISIYPSGHVYVSGHYVGYLNTNANINKAVDAKGSNGSALHPQKGIAYAIKVGSVKHHDITIMIPNKYRTTYDNLVSQNDKTDLARQMDKYGDHTDAHIIRHGYNYGNEGKAMRYWIGYYVNKARKQHGLKPYVSNSRLNAIANVRVIQASQSYRTQPKSALRAQQYGGNDTASDNWIHGMKFHDTASDDSQSLDLVPFTTLDKSNEIDECAGDTGFGNTTLTDMGHTYHEYSSTPRQLAKNAIIFGMVDHDKSSHNGHRNTILNKKMHAMNVAVKGYRGRHGETRFSFVFEAD